MEGTIRTFDLEQSWLEEANRSLKGIGAAQDAVRMQRVVSFYEKLPRGPAPEIKASGLLGRYQARYFGKNPSAAPIVHVIGALIVLGYCNNYYFHLRHHKNNAH
ncbi:ATP synthase f chain, mitochondrial precursor [Xylographa pallens]|nr:ATP synthase f chain, mitochondrial precursor [Xylographa pallens]